MAATSFSSSGFGASVPRLEDARFLTGNGQFGDNVAAGHAAASVVFLRSPHAHARLGQIDGSAAQRLPGVLAILTARETVADNLGHLPAISEIADPAGKRHNEPPRLPMAPDKVRHVGEIVAMIVAETPQIARDAAELISVDYQPLPAVATADDALRPGAPLVHDQVPGNLMCGWQRGDRAATDAVFADAAHVVRVSFRFNRIVANYLEPRALLAQWDAAHDRVTLTGPSQGVHTLHRLLTERVLKWPADKLRMVTGDVGGGFGPKFTLYPEHALMAWAARRLGRDLRWVCERSEAYVSDCHARDLVADAALALDADGHFLALKVEAAANFGAYVSLYAPTIPTGGLAKTISGLYRIPSIHVDMRCAFSNTVQVDAFRGAGKPEALLLLERLVDKAAARLGIDAAELRRRNLLAAGELPYRTPLGYSYDSGDFPRLLSEAQQLADVGSFHVRRASSARRGLLRGLGWSCHLHGTGGIADETSRLLVHGDGKVEAFAGTQSQGQGHETVYAQIVASRLGLTPGEIKLVQGDTARVISGGGSGGSSSTIISGTTLVLASEALIVRGRDLASEALETAAADIVYADGAFRVVGTDRTIDLFALARHAGSRGEIFDAAARFADRIESWPSGVMVCELEIDPETGAIRIDRFSSVADLGAVVNPMLCDAQMHGGIVQGIGNALGEDAIYDRESAQLLAGSLMDYPLPRADEICELRHRSIAIPSPNNALGIKGVGELPNNGALAAVVNAALDALRPLGIEDIALPLTPQRVWQAIAARG